MSKTLLLADDSVTIQRVVELIFASEDIRVVAVGDGRRAVQTLDADGADIVLVDVEVPELDGYGVVSHIKKSTELRHIPVLMLAGALGPADEDKARRLGCSGVIIKPFEPQALLNRVRELLRVAEQRQDVHGSKPPGTQPSQRHLEAASSPRVEPIAPEPLEPPRRPVWDAASEPRPAAAPPAAAPAAAVPPPEAAGQEKVSLVSAFSALLETFRSNRAPDAPPPEIPQATEAIVEEAIRRVLDRITGDEVRRIVAETAERMVREEIVKIRKTSPE
jgi:CheY-like chemotaxis protein